MAATQQTQCCAGVGGHEDKQLAVFADEDLQQGRQDFWTSTVKNVIAF